ncbi:hypothetical protein [Blastopirellula marina]|uniref:Uncharacterized protein n=1 Tax=Blastopirellula marina TaxID=124 RepID=A0A2S8FA66_9BACT|nr:hypothetical protein [Blastopirellula marina]PQO29041.1 hypothetical protein C5Y98_22820 [Blastopirellula marina]PTL42313.1 hypothetical protein C5Y97_22830 [Blastopirellula marina]
MPRLLGFLMLVTPAVTTLQTLGCALLLSELRGCWGIPQMLALILFFAGAMSLGISHSLIACQIALEDCKVASYAVTAGNILLCFLVWSWVVRQVMTSWT